MSLGQNKSGMQAGAEIQGWKRTAIQSVIKAGANVAALQSWVLEKLGAHKQVSNRYLEPYSWCTQIFSATDVANLFLLRNHPDAEPHFHELAKQMQRQARIANETLKAMLEDGLDYMHADGHPEYQVLHNGEWHLPLVMQSELEELDLDEAKKVSAARCARTSYTLLGGRVSFLHEDLSLCEKLFGSQPMHLSPTEHQAQALSTSSYWGNFRGFKQFRKELLGENPDAKMSPEIYTALNSDEIKIILDLTKGYILGKAASQLIFRLQNAYTRNN
jgi:hypothetical protein